MKIKRPLAFAACIAAAAGFVFAVFFPEAIMPAFVSAQAQEMADGDEITVSGRVYKIQKKTYSVYVYLKNSRSKTKDGDYLKAGKVIVLISADEFDEYNLKIGNVISADGNFLEFEKARNKGNYDEENYYKSLGIFLKVQSNSLEISSDFVNFPAQLMMNFKERMIEAFDEMLTDKESAAKGIFCAVTTGERTYLTSGTKSLYSENGISHILAISGLHISIIGMGLFGFLRKIAGPRKSAVICGIVMFLYCVMCGMSVSALRATIMFLVHMATYLTGKTYDILSALGAAALCVLLSEPFYILNSGFLLSFGAILSIAVLNKNLSEFLKPKRKITKSLLSGVCVTVSLLPAVASVYFAVPLYSVLLNLLVIPLMSFVLASALAGGIAGIINTFAGRFFLGLGYYAVTLINLACYLAGLCPFSSIVTGCPGVIRIILFYLVLCVFAIFIRRVNLNDRKRKAFADSRKTGGRAREKHVPEHTAQGAWTSQRRQAAGRFR